MRKLIKLIFAAGTTFSLCCCFFACTNLNAGWIYIQPDTREIEPTCLAPRFSDIKPRTNERPPEYCIEEIDLDMKYEIIDKKIKEIHNLMKKTQMHWFHFHLDLPDLDSEKKQDENGTEYYDA